LALVGLVQPHNVIKDDVALVQGTGRPGEGDRPAFVPLEQLLGCRTLLLWGRGFFGFHGDRAMRCHAMLSFCWA
jgi:hypothetical protein